MTTNPVYRCEELEDAVSLYDAIEDNDSMTGKMDTSDRVYLELLSDETEEHDQGTKPPLPKPRPETGPHDQDRGYEGLTDKTPDHMYIQLRNDETQQRDQAEDQVQDTDAEYQDTKSPD